MNQNSLKTDAVAMISGGRITKSEKLEAQRYWEIVSELIWRGAERFKAEDTAKWAGRAEPGAETKIKTSSYPDILLKIKKKGLKS